MSSNLKSKKLIILISVLVAVVAVIVILASVFSVREVNPVVHDFVNGHEILHPDDAPTENDILKLSKGKSMFFMSKDWLLDELNKEFHEWHAFAVVKNFPNIIDVHFVRRQAAAKVDIAGNLVYIDSYGYVVEPPAEGNYVDISSAFDYRDATVSKTGEKLQFTDDANNERLAIVLEAIIASWRCYVDFDDMPIVFGAENVFTFNDSGNLIVHTLAKAQIIIVDPSSNLTDRLLSAYGVYYNDKLNLQQDVITITVEKNGNIITPNTNK